MAISHDFGQFSRRMAIRSTQVAGGAERAIRRAAVAADTALVMTTPVDTGRARGNWNVSVGRIDDTVYSSNFPGPSEALAQGQMTIGKWKLGSGVIFIANSLPYIQRLEDGYSAQAPSGMVQFAMKAAIEQLGGEGLFD
jgi:hypothetical protein